MTVTTKRFLIVLSLLLLSCSLFALDNGILYNYDYNRYFKGSKDLVFALSANIHNKSYRFKNQNTRNEDGDGKTGLGIGFEFIERRNRYSFYQGFDVSSDSAKLTQNKFTVNSINLRLGYQRDHLWVVANKPFTVYLGGGVVARFDWVRKSKGAYKDVIFLGLTGKAGLTWHFSSKNGCYSLFAQYQPDWFLLNNAYSLNGGFSGKAKNFIFNNTVNIGVHVNIQAFSSAVNERRAEKSANRIDNSY